MKLSDLNDNLLKRMSSKDRASMGLLTSDEAMAKFKARSEKELQESICSLLRLRGIAFYRTRMDRAQTGTVGWPDITCAVDGIPLGLEAKIGNTKPTQDQLDCHSQMMKNGWRVYVVRSLPEVKEILDALEQEHLLSIKF